MSNNNTEKDLKVLRIVKGNDLKSLENSFSNYKEASDVKKDIFLETYLQAVHSVKDIITATEKYHKNAKTNGIHNTNEYFNNIIAFCGDRGEGKTSAMNTFVSELCKSNHQDSLLLNYFTSLPQYDADKDYIKSTDFISIGTIDPSLFESNHYVLNIIISRLYQSFNKKVNEKSQSEDRWKINALYSLFQKVYEGISYLRVPKRADDLVSNYENSLEQLSRIDDCSNLSTTVKELVTKYFEYMNIDNANNTFLLIALDDFDTSIAKAYSIAEEIRKYLFIPNVIIVMAVKIEQLTSCLQGEFVHQMQDLCKTNTDLVSKSTYAMANKYIEKLIPHSRRFYLPTLSELYNNSRFNLSLQYLDSGKFQKAITDEIKSNDVEVTLYSLLYRYTNIIFVPKKHVTTPIAPKSLRELVHFLAVIDEMEDPIIRDNDEEKKDAEILKKNTEIFLHYFLNSICHNILTPEYYDILLNCSTMGYLEQHKYICNKLLELLDNADEVLEKDFLNLNGIYLEKECSIEKECSTSKSKDSAEEISSLEYYKYLNKNFNNFSISNTLSILELYLQERPSEYVKKTL